ncbi:UPF0481 protein At3g47200 [Daucus carota subsp. sativus]|uniref:UPF0481 protein At3g47200 n=1 Tax=Daucus carota subsp. sativus TaxID=79200 RepID=UPI0007F01456|nr:PREDICTED: UPF0481 protein At3g47200-like [Daucus carota subsp. sativus]XP_017227006.1 PREDICTED: UPF0481 protein At3g47200-like [Daucus carota subsp. sativus]XP_017227007.1 PREDICTED: UPF0481 protein At3g47200-like [Daucus carota subsp. sativus]XP_017227031.1 PREDICTED: UPF0481 protein At3g47200-like [Daucus carota subsp. sativus]XP_017227032.1 PREDICTED: UPF0481 protein At3g47200-like [Daucus carota subsp. sativus]XP_017227033.1 PREDICTED: UPF0481 protein At3g47200-like [Daucus carota sub
MEAERRPRRDASTEIAQGHENFVFSIREKMEKVSHSGCICKIPDKLFSHDEEKYTTPTLVSIGPLHHGKENLTFMDGQKWYYINTLLSRTPNLEKYLDICVEKLRELEWKARNCYEDLKLETNEFIEMMLLDGLFIIELFLKLAVKSLRRRGDIIFNAHETFIRLRSDLILLENQIPFFILRELFTLVPIPEQCSLSLTQLALHFFRSMISGDVQILQKKFGQDFSHLLDLVHQSYLPTYPMVQHSEAETNLHCATKLKALGVDIKKSKNDILLNISFFDGVLQVPYLNINDHTEILLRNFIAMEHCNKNCSKHVTSYVYLIRYLMQSEEDARLLHRRSIFTGLEEEKIVIMFTRMHVEIEVEEFYYKGLCDQIDKYVKAGKQEKMLIGFARFCRKAKALIT